MEAYNRCPFVSSLFQLASVMFSGFIHDYVKIRYSFLFIFPCYSGDGPHMLGKNSTTDLHNSPIPFYGYAVVLFCILGYLE